LAAFKPKSIGGYSVRVRDESVCYFARRNHAAASLLTIRTSILSLFSTPEYDGLPHFTVSCEIVDTFSKLTLQWRMSAESHTEYLTEIATILAAGLLRLRSRKSSPNSPTEADSPLDCERVFCRHETGNFEDSEQ
jgi:hypothetical protein